MFSRQLSRVISRHQLCNSFNRSSSFLRHFGTELGEQRVDDEFVFPVHTSCDTENSFCWSGAVINNEVCNLNSDEFIAEKKSVLLRGKNVVVVKAEHRGLGMVSFAAIKSESIPEWRFCSIAIHGDPIDANKVEKYYGEIKETIEGFVSCLFGKQLGHSSNSSSSSDSAKRALLSTVHSKYLTPEYLIGNYPHDAGHFKFPGNYYKSAARNDQELLGLSETSPPPPTTPTTSTSTISPDDNTQVNMSAVIRDHEHLMSILNPGNTVAAALRSVAMVSRRHVFYSEFKNTSATVSSVNMTPVLIAECSAWVTVDLKLETPMSTESDDDFAASNSSELEVIRSKIPTAESTNMLLQLIPHWENSEFTWKVCNILCLD